jgi:PKD repeat protein
MVAGFASAVLITGTGAAGAAVPNTLSGTVQRTSGTVSADALPTVQIDNGVVWSQAIVGNTVYAGGEFQNTRPAGAKVGTSLTPRSNLLAYDITTGNLITSFAPTVNAAVRVVAASPDGKTVYIGGTFTSINGSSRFRIAAFSTATGALITTFKPILGTQVNAIVATNTTVYVGGNFTSAAGVTRNRLAAFSAATGALLGWNPNADGNVNAMVMTPDGSRLIVGGAFQNVAGAPNYGLAAVDATTGAVLPWAANQTVRDAGSASAIESLNTDGNAIYGTGYVYGAGGNLEGMFSADPNSGAINWIESCHGDTYDSYPNAAAGVVYVVSHEHFCGDSGGFPQTDTPWVTHRTTAFTTQATGTLQHDYFGGSYKDWNGYASPSLVNWLPDLLAGSYTGQGQAAWTVTGNSKYVIEGGEFGYVNDKLQQGLVRFAVPSIAPNTQGPRQALATFLPNLSVQGLNSVRVSFQANWDRDDQNLTYQVYRDGNVKTPIWTTTATSQYWNRPMLGFTDAGLSAGTHTYQVWAKDPGGNVTKGNVVSITVPGAAPTQTVYGQRMIADGASPYLPLDEAAGATTSTTTTFNDHAGYGDQVVSGGVTLGATGPVAGSSAAQFDGSTGYSYQEATPSFGPNTFSLEAWFKTTSTTGGQIIGYGSAQLTKSQTNDRVVYMSKNGQIYFGGSTNNRRTIHSLFSYRDGAWHQVVATMSSSGSALYVDGNKVASDGSMTSGQTLYPGGWRIGGDNLNNWSSVGSSYFAGSIGQVSVFPTVLSASQVSSHYGAAFSTDVPPTAAFTQNCTDLSCTFDGSGSSDSDGSVTGYAWDFGDGATATGATPAHSFAAAGTYPVRLTVTDDQGATGTITQQVTVLAPNIAPIASFTVGKTNLAVSVDGSGSSDPDGTVASYAWDFGDSGTGTGATASHTYAAGGTYTISLTVTDNRGGTNTTTQSVSVAPPPNVPPTAAFTSSPDGTTVTFDGSGSSDSDGTVAAYAWNFGDGATSTTGAKVSHTYGATGTYSVSLTVTDNSGATNTATQNVVVSTVTTFASDTFNRTLSGGWGSADVGGAWSLAGGTTPFSVTPGTGKMAQAAAGAAPGAFLKGLTLGDTDATVDVAMDQAATGGGEYLYLGARHTGSGTSAQDYRLQAKVTSTGVVQLSLLKVVATTTTTLKTVTLSGVTYSPNLILHLRFQVSGTSSVTLQGKLWTGSTEPTAWTVASTDASSPLPSGAPGLWTTLSGSATTVPVNVSWSNFAVRNIA